ncbi:carboxylesterase/lipase family protein [Nocardia halotolerans]|uniref:Carboxylic ester hydrolase n=1 Tax=Nocardia halotolerans TaxID=1755878 RepID=A0ABV8VEC3_9NOCA
MSDSGNTARPVVTVRDGAVRGIGRGDTAAFFGIPFAAPPIGRLRYLAPAAPASWEGVRDASAPGPTPLRFSQEQQPMVPETPVPGDSILNVNVFAPAPIDPAAGLPVLVWIHGGGYTAGSPTSPWYDGRRFAGDGVVTVTMSYRLGFDGFGFVDGAPLNRGLLDQIAALAWVRDNIAAFGGDPDRVTLAGQSAGGGSVLALLSAPAARGLFHQAVVQSGVLSRMTPERAREHTRALGALLGVEGTDLPAWRAVDETTVLEQLPALTEQVAAAAVPTSIEEFVDRIVDPYADLLGMALTPVVDGETLLGFEDAVAAGFHRGIALLIGTTAHEFVTTADNDAAPRTAARALRGHGVYPETAQRFLDDAAALGPNRVTGQLVAEARFRRPAVQVVAARGAAGEGERTWMYDFRHRSPVVGAAAHCHEIPYVWDLLGAPGVSARLGEHPPQSLADTMHYDWVAFVTDGRCAWPATTTLGRGAMIYDATPSFTPDGYQLDWELAAHGAQHGHD